MANGSPSFFGNSGSSKGIAFIPAIAVVAILLFFGTDIYILNKQGEIKEEISAIQDEQKQELINLVKIKKDQGDNVSIETEGIADKSITTEKLADESITINNLSESAIEALKGERGYQGISGEDGKDGEDADRFSLGKLKHVDITSVASGDLLYYNGNTWVNLIDGSSGQVLTSNGSGGLSWTTATLNDLQGAYDSGAAIITAGGVPISFDLASGGFNVSGAGAVSITPSGTLTLDSSAAANLGTTNATAVSIGNGSATTTINGPLAVSEYADFTPGAAPTYQEGRVFYDSTTKTLSYYNNSDDIKLNIGQSLWAKAKNATGSSIPKGSAVYVTGSDGLGNITVDLAKADDFATSQVAGITAESIASGDVGYMVLSGAIYNLDTSAFSPGDTLYLSPTTAGEMTSSKPTYPNYAMPLAVVAFSDASQGAIGASIGAFAEGSFTAGAVAFGGTDGLNGTDASNLFWDDTANRLGIGDNTPQATLTVGSGDLFEVFGATGNVTTQGDITLVNGGGAITATDGGLTLVGQGASSFSTTAGNITLQSAGTGTTGNIQIGVGGAGSTTPDLFALDVKSDAGDPAGYDGAMYYNKNDGEFRCYEDGAWMDCDGTSYHSLQNIYNGGATITTAGSTDIAFTLTDGDFTATGAGAVNLTPTSASSFTSGDALTLTAGATSTWSTSTGDLNVNGAGALALLGGTSASLSTTAGDITLQSAGSGTTGNIQIGVGGAGSSTPDLLVLDVKSDAEGALAGTDGAMYYNESTNKFRCHVNGSWADCDTTGGTTTLQSAYNGGATITTAGSTDIAFTLTDGDFTATGAGAVNLTPTSASSFTSGDALTLTAGAASTWGTSAGNLTLQVAGAGTSANVQIGAGGAGSATPDLLVLDVKSDAEGLLAGTNGAMYYNANSNSFRCYASGSWQECGATAASATTLQQAYVAGQSINLNSGDLGISGAGSVSIAPSGTLTLTAGAASTWGTSAGNLNLQVAGAGTSANVQIGSGVASATPDRLVLDQGTADPAGTNGSMYYNTGTNRFRCYEDSAWVDCGTNAPSTNSLQDSYDNGAAIVTAGGVPIAFTLTNGNFNVTGAGAVSMTPSSTLTLTAGAASTWSTSSGALTVDSAAALNLGTVNATAISIGKSATTTTINGGLTIPKYIDLTNSSNPSYSEGRIFYDTEEKSLAYYSDLTGTTINVGQEERVRVYNNTGSPIADGKAVYISGVFNDTPTIALAKADDVNTTRAIGMTTTTIADGASYLRRNP